MVTAIFCGSLEAADDFDAGLSSERRDHRAHVPGVWPILGSASEAKGFIHQHNRDAPGHHLPVEMASRSRPVRRFRSMTGRNLPAPSIHKRPAASVWHGSAVDFVTDGGHDDRPDSYYSPSGLWTGRFYGRGGVSSRLTLWRYLPLSSWWSYGRKTRALARPEDNRRSIAQPPRSTLLDVVDDGVCRIVLQRWRQHVRE